VCPRSDVDESIAEFDRGVIDQFGILKGFELPITTMIGNQFVCHDDIGPIGPIGPMFSSLL
jgi:hypothetical protein